MPPKILFRVLCVDDDEDACEMLALLLQSHEIDVTCVSSAAEAWPKITAEPFDLYLLDGWIPKLDGFEFCRQIRESDTHTPIVFYSGAAYETDKRMAFAAGANAYVTKPDIAGLIEVTQDLVEKARAKRVAAPSTSNRPTSVELRPSIKVFSAKLAAVH